MVDDSLLFMDRCNQRTLKIDFNADYVANSFPASILKPPFSE